MKMGGWEVHIPVLGRGETRRREDQYMVCSWADHHGCQLGLSLLGSSAKQCILELSTWGWKGSSFIVACWPEMALFCVNFLTLSGCILKFQQVLQMSHNWGIWVSKVKVTRCSWSKAPSSYTCIKVVAPAKARVKHGLKRCERWHKRCPIHSARPIFVISLLLIIKINASSRSHSLFVKHMLVRVGWHRTRFPHNLRAIHSDLYCLSALTSYKLHTHQSILVPLCCRLFVTLRNPRLTELEFPNLHNEWPG